jgi:uncharacterized membrane protein YdbT with pleckstrin-like domain
MSYIESNLQADEKVLDRTTVHWIVYLPGLILLVVAPCAFIVAYQVGSPAEDWRYFLGPPLILAISAVIALVRAAITYLTTEIAITDRRIIYKSGLISQRTVEMNVDKVESVDVNQPVLGRFLDYGTILVRGVGTGLEPLDQVAAPLKFRDTVLSLTAPSSFSPTVPPSGFPSQKPAIPEGRVFGHRPIQELR